jgi:hypothetical protein
MGGAEAVLALSVPVMVSYGESTLGTGRPLAVAAFGRNCTVPSGRHHGMIDMGPAGRGSFACPARRRFGGLQRARQREHSHHPGPEPACLPQSAPVEAFTLGSMHTCRPSRERRGLLGRQFRCSRKSLRNRFIVQAARKSLGVLVRGANSPAKLTKNEVGRATPSLDTLGIMPLLAIPPRLLRPPIL